MEKCTGCGKGKVDVIKFPCPQCGMGLVRCTKCRALSIKYTCPSCGFIGP